MIVVLAGCGKSSEESSGDNKAAKGKIFKIGINQYVEHPSLDEATVGFKEAIKENGLKVDYDEQNAQGDTNSVQTMAKKMVSENVDLIFANATPSAQASLNATSDIPIIFASVADPVGAKLVKSMDHTGPNITGTTHTNPHAIPKTVAFIDEQTDAKTVGLIYNKGEINAVSQVNSVKAAMKGTDLLPVEATVTTSAEVKQAAQSLVGRADVFYIVTDNTVVSALESVIGVARNKNIPLFVGELDSVKRGGFAAYGFDFREVGYEAGKMAVKVLKGEKKPSELPVQYPKDLRLVINKKAAKEMGVKIKPEWEKEADFIK
ncbi:ABC transporter substrate-binding protein [Scopulibacillus darangshiensis]|nr:ABC transporter substrate-binding protein [Scopulibacillus darangshiensis]